MSQQDFDNGCAAFTITMGRVANWKHSYAGAAYSTRLRHAINDARIACDRLEKLLAADKCEGCKVMRPTSYIAFGLILATAVNVTALMTKARAETHIVKPTIVWIGDSP